MKNAINYYYNLFPNQVHQKDDREIYFNINDDKYVLLLYDEEYGDVNYFYNLSLRLLQNNVPCHQFIFNINKILVTNVNDKNYVLFKIFVDNEKLVDINDLYSFFAQTKHIKMPIESKNYFDLWSSKIDYYEYQITQYSKQFPLIRESFNYHIGLAENALILYKTIYNEQHHYNVIAHNRIKKDCKVKDLYNPLNFVVDIEARSFAEYFKTTFFYGDINIDEQIFNYLKILSYSPYEGVIFFSRMMFPTYYFDLYELIINDLENEKDVMNIISKVNLYEKILSNIYKYLSLYTNIPRIEWLDRVDG